jgi:hypothetical protein
MISCDPDGVDFIGEDYVCWASDYPHWDAIFPGAVEELPRHMEGLSETATQDPRRQRIPLHGPAGVGAALVSTAALLG